ncbi:uncharacterized protein [Primulina eburnea]|uniref:uncharacterized protein n=1 Tax=Primulina eburnea TaxID=1245227 RepID=UPI003C6C6212
MSLLTPYYHSTPSLLSTFTGKNKEQREREKQLGDKAMKSAIRCCISCILPCGALDVIRIVHANGRVEELGTAVKAAEILKLHPRHILKKPTSKLDNQGTCPRIVVVPPDSLLKRGKIYFLIPLPPSPEKNRPKRKKKESHHESGEGTIPMRNLSISDRHLTEILSEKVSDDRDRRRGRRVGVWRPHLQSISELPAEANSFMRSN